MEREPDSDVAPGVHDVRGRRVLICHSIVHDLIGSTIVTLDLATALRELGAEVLVYATFVGDPAAALFAERGIEVADDAAMAGRRFSDFDLVWVHSQALPEAMVEQFAEPQDLPPFVFLHMSAIHYAPDEHPYVHELEERLSSLSLFIAPRTREKLLPFFETPPPTGIYPNPTPREYSLPADVAPDVPGRVLVVSNHADPALMAAKDLLRERGVYVTHVGRTGDLTALVTPELLAPYDVVLSIGKTVQYCLVAGRPVFIHDHLGGYGYLDDASYEKARHHNFSGRHGPHRTAEQIATEVLDGYAAAVDWHAEHRERFAEEFAIEHVLPRVLREIRPREVEPFPEPYRHALRSAQAFGARFFHYWGHNANEVRNREALTAEVARGAAEREALAGDLAAAHADADRLRDELAALRASPTFRLAATLAAPARPLRRRIQHRRRRDA